MSQSRKDVVTKAIISAEIDNGSALAHVTQTGNMHVLDRDPDSLNNDQILFDRLYDRYGHSALTDRILRSLCPDLYLHADNSDLWTDAAVQFTAANNSWLEMASNYDPGTSDFAVAFWVYLDSATTHGVISTGGGSNGVDGFYLYVDASDQLTLAINDSVQGSRASGVLATGLSTGSWYFVVVNFDRDGNATAYVDNVAKSTLDISGQAATLGATQGNVGAYELDTGHMDGRVDSLGIWDRLLTADEITELYNSGLGWIYEDLNTDFKTNIAHWYELGENTGIRYDSYGTNNLLQPAP